MTEYEIDIRNIQPEYKHTIDRDAGREVEQGMEVHLKNVRVEVCMNERAHDGGRWYYAVRFAIDHDDESTTATMVGDAHQDEHSFNMDRLVLAIEYAERAFASFLIDVELDHYDTEWLQDRAEALVDRDGKVNVHTELEVSDNE